MIPHPEGRTLISRVWEQGTEENILTWGWGRKGGWI